MRVCAYTRLRFSSSLASFFTAGIRKDDEERREKEDGCSRQKDPCGKLE